MLVRDLLLVAQEVVASFTCISIAIPSRDAALLILLLQRSQSGPWKTKESRAKHFLLLLFWRGDCYSNCPAD